MPGFSDYIIYVDESGDHSLSSIDPQYPIFCLSFCVFHKQVYSDQITPAVRQLKFSTFGHDMVVLHERDIRKKKGAFSMMGKTAREDFMNELTAIIDGSDFTLFSVVIDKRRLAARYTNPAHPYHLSMEFGLERLYRFLRDNGQSDKLSYVVCESRGKKEDAELELEFRRIQSGGNYFRVTLPFEIIIVDKKSNSEGLQLADLTARPIGISVLNPGQPNRARNILDSKFYKNGAGRIEGFGLKVFP